MKIRTRFFPVVIFALALGAVSSPIGHAESKPAAYSDAEAATHKGEDAAVTGKVFGVSKSAKGTTFINFGARYPNHTFTGVVFAGDTQKVGDLSALADQTVTLTGRIELSPDGKPQIIIKSLDQITVQKSVAPPTPAPAPASPAPPLLPQTTPPVAANPAPAPQPTPTPKTPDIKRIALAANWTNAPQSGEMTRKDLATIFGDQITPGKNTADETSIVIYPDVPYLTPLATARKKLNLENTAPTRTKITTPGLPADSLVANTFAGIFRGRIHEHDARHRRLRASRERAAR